MDTWEENMDDDALSWALNSSPTTTKDRRTLILHRQKHDPDTIGRSDAATLDPVLEKVKVATAADPTKIELRQLIRNDKCNLSAAMRPSKRYSLWVLYYS